MSDQYSVVHLLRHGEVHNPEGVLYGRLPGYRLSERGTQMAETAAQGLAQHDIAAVIASPMERAQQTADPIAEVHGLTVRTEPLAIEADNVFEGKRVSVGDGVLRQPRTWRHLWNPFARVGESPTRTSPNACDELSRTLEKWQTVARLFW